MQNTNKKLFEETPVPQAVQTMMIPTIIGALVTVLYSLADTLFVGMMNDQIQNAWQLHWQHRHFWHLTL